MNILDRIISVFSPTLAAKRIRARRELRSYDGAKHGRRLKNWVGDHRGQNHIVAASIETLKARSRDLVRNNSYAKRAIDVRKTAAVGSGIRATINSESPAIEQRARSAWRGWAEKPIDVRDKMNLYALQAVAMESVDRDGEVFIVKRFQDGVLKLQVLTSDYLDYTRDSITTNSRTRQGIQFDELDRATGYWFYRDLPNDLVFTSYPESKFYQAENVIHLYIESIPGQFRGVPTGSPAFVRLWNLNNYEDAQLERQKLAASVAAYVHGGEADGLLDTDDDGNKTEEFQPGMIQYLPPGKEIVFPRLPETDEYSEFVKQQLRAIAVAFGITYEALGADYENVNFSSSRMGRMEMDNIIQDLQYHLLIPQLCERVYDWFVSYQEIVSPAIDWAEVKVTWTPPRREFIDPVKEANGLKTMIRMGLMSPQEAIKKLGYDHEDIINDLEKWQQLSEEKGLVFDSNPLHDPKRTNFDGEAPENETNNDE